MKYVYEVSFSKKVFNNYTDEKFSPWVIAENVDRAKRKAILWLTSIQKAKKNNYRIDSILQKGSIDIE